MIGRHSASEFPRSCPHQDLVISVSEVQIQVSRANKVHENKMSDCEVAQRRVFRRTDNYTPGAPKLKLVQKALPLPLAPTAVLIKVHAVALNYRDANIANGGNPWPVVPNGILCNDAAGEIIAKGDKVKRLAIGDKVAPIVDTENISGRELGRPWLAADEDGVMASHLMFDEAVLCKLPDYLDWVDAAIIPCAGVTVWAALKGMSIGQTVDSRYILCLRIDIMTDEKQALEESACSRSSLPGLRAFELFLLPPATKNFST